MLHIDKLQLDNGLRILIHQDPGSPIANFNLLYNVGSKDENASRTGFAHLFEHLMFGGSANIPSFDEPLERVGGENNAFTSNDITNYYITLPKENLETAFWLESDRMLALDFSNRSLEVQRSVVVEEFNQRYLNQPYGDAWLLLRPLAYTVHPYRWPTIGMDTQHILDATLSEVKDFFYRYYAPNNAILSIVGDVDPDEVERLALKWFGPIPARDVPQKDLPKEPKQTEPRTLTVEREVPYDTIYQAYHMCNRTHPNYPATDLLSDVLSNGKSSRLNQRLVKEQKLFSSVNAYITGDVDEGLFIVTGRLIEGVQFDKAQAAIEEVLKELGSEPVPAQELEKVKNKFESNHTFALTSPLEKAMNICMHELLGDAQSINNVLNQYKDVTPEDIMRVASEVFQSSNCSTLCYKAKNNI